MTTRVEATDVPGGLGVRIATPGVGGPALVAAAPVVVLTWKPGTDTDTDTDADTDADTGTGVETEHRAPYESLTVTADGLVGTARIDVGGGTVLQVEDRWDTDGDDVRMARRVTVRGGQGPARGYGTAVVVEVDAAAPWERVEPFCPGVAYGNAPQVAPLAIAGVHARRAGVTTAIVREDRAAAPLFGIRLEDGGWAAIAHRDPRGDTIAADGMVEDGGETIVDPRLAFASIGARSTGDRVELGVWFPGTEGPVTYSSGGLPLLQLDAWRRRFHPLDDGATQEYAVAVRTGGSTDFPDVVRQTWRWVWDRFAPAVRSADIADVVRSAAAVLADQVVAVGGRTGVPLEADAVVPQRTDEATAAVMGFVGANTDAAVVLLREADSTDDGAVAERYRASGLAIIDSFVTLALDPPAGEGFDTVTGATTTYRTFRDQPAVYARAVAEGALAVLDALALERRHGEEHPSWAAWVTTAASWLLRNQALDGSLPRAWVAGTGEVLDDSPSGTATVVPFLVAVGSEEALAGAVRAAEFVWREYGRRGWYAGGTLDNPDVVDKEAAVLAAEGFLDLYDATGGAEWLDRAASAASVAETWIYVWDVPMPEDADPGLLHWKHGVSTIGHQLIASGVSMTDGFLAVNASVFARLFALTHDDHWLDVARVVTHGTTTMFATVEHAFDLRGVGWQQEHWSFAPRRGFGLNRRWLPWVPVAHARGMYRVEDRCPPDVAARVLRAD
ncbi:hypothetical protein DEI93_12260 [Curtobacterium sp. MCBD17_035]|uniref:hypothetical protein n=1 Tax=Curtobacterium sp. MCBD17_035 TaxID=2175673 RepID=UPI000DA92FA3|nr:hypothetical protein [Curtobacterium sp. MCBD17_035]WIB66731.1 hypothetical protein DEI93_12260 [Curtobacterium sp. MCBD17_035]